MLVDEENFKFQMVQKVKNNVRNYKFFGEIFLLVFSNFLHFYIQWKIADEILLNLQTIL